MNSRITWRYRHARSAYGDVGLTADGEVVRLSTGETIEPGTYLMTKPGVLVHVLDGFARIQDSMMNLAVEAWFLNGVWLHRQERIDNQKGQWTRLSLSMDQSDNTEYAGVIIDPSGNVLIGNVLYGPADCITLGGKDYRIVRTADNAWLKFFTATGTMLIWPNPSRRHCDASDKYRTELTPRQLATWTPNVPIEEEPTPKEDEKKSPAPHAPRKLTRVLRLIFLVLLCVGLLIVFFPAGALVIYVVSKANDQAKEKAEHDRVAAFWEKEYERREKEVPHVPAECFDGPPYFFGGFVLGDFVGFEQQEKDDADR